MKKPTYSARDWRVLEDGTYCYYVTSRKAAERLTQEIKAGGTYAVVLPPKTSTNRS